MKTMSAFLVLASLAITSPLACASGPDPIPWPSVPKLISPATSGPDPIPWPQPARQLAVR